MKTKLILLSLSLFAFSNFGRAQSTTAGSAVGSTRMSGSMLPSDQPVQKPSNSDVISSQQSSTTAPIPTPTPSNCVSNDSSDTVCGTNAVKYCNSHAETEQCKAMTKTMDQTPSAE